MAGRARALLVCRPEEVHMNRQSVLAAIVVTAGFAVSCSNSSGGGHGASGSLSSGSSGATGVVSGSSGGTGSVSGGAGSVSGSAGSMGTSGASGSSGGDAGGCTGATPVSLTVDNFRMWCSVSVAGGAASSAPTQTMCVAAGTVNLSATANATFVLGPTPWHGTTGDTGLGDPGMVTGSGQTTQSATTVTVSGASACVSVCCPGATGTPACPTTNQCPAGGGSNIDGGGATMDGGGPKEGGSTATPILNSLSTIATVGSTIDPNNNPAIDPTGSGTNPYGLVIAPASAGLITAGDLVACNFNNGPNTVQGSPAPNTQGQGTTVVGLHPVASADAGGNPGGNPYHIAQSASLLGCSALSMFPDDSIAATAFSASIVPVVAPSGSVSSPFAADNLAKPWSSAYVAAANGQPAALYVSNATGSINRITLNSSNAQTGFAPVATGFCVSGAVQGSTDSLHAPSGLTYDPKIDTLYVVDTSSYSVVAFAHVSSIAASGITVNGGNCSAAPPTAAPTFTGPSMSSASVIATPSSPNGGQQFNAPISAALLLNGNVVVGNADQDLTPNDAGTNQNLLFEISPTLGVVGSKQLDTGAPGALFGIAAGPDGNGNQVIYFNDDNDNTVKVLSK
jgi:hypothetical protein